jgi:cytochrome b561
MLRDTPESWGSLTRFLHWGMAVLILAELALGWTAKLWRLSPTKLDLFVWHKSIGILLLGLALLRLLWRLANPTPVLPAGMPRWEQRAARTSHATLYFLMFAMPLSGWVAHSAANIPLKLFWLVPLPDIVAPDKALAELAKGVHLALFLLFVAVLTLHVAAALYHHFRRRDTVLARMLSGSGGHRP